MERQSQLPPPEWSRLRYDHLRFWVPGQLPGLAVLAGPGEREDLNKKLGSCESCVIVGLKKTMFLLFPMFAWQRLRPIEGTCHWRRQVDDVNLVIPCRAQSILVIVHLWFVKHTFLSFLSWSLGRGWRGLGNGRPTSKVFHRKMQFARGREKHGAISSFTADTNFCRSTYSNFSISIRQLPCSASREFRPHTRPNFLRIGARWYWHRTCRSRNYRPRNHTDFHSIHPFCQNGLSSSETNDVASPGVLKFLSWRSVHFDWK